MKAAFTVWNGRISPVFDVARYVLLVELSQNEIVNKAQVLLPSGSPTDKIGFLSDQGVQVLVCGAVSCSMQYAIKNRGIDVIAFRSGEIRDLVLAWKNERIKQTCYAMPGCGDCF